MHLKTSRFHFRLIKSNWIISSITYTEKKSKKAMVCNLKNFYNQNLKKFLINGFRHRRKGANFGEIGEILEPRQKEI